MGAQHETSIAVLAGKGTLIGVHRCLVIAKTVARCKTLGARLALIAQSIAHAMHRNHVQLELKIASEFLLTLRTGSQRFGCTWTRWRSLCWSLTFRFIRFLLLPLVRLTPFFRLQRGGRLMYGCIQYTTIPARRRCIQLKVIVCCKIVRKVQCT